LSYQHKSKFISIYRALQTGHPSGLTGLKSLDEEQKKQWDQFIYDAGAIWLEIKDELDEAIESLGDGFSDSDPRKWEPLDWWEFYAGVEDHPLKEILIKYAKGESNLDLIWEELSNRL
jgi:hypothetical protein